MIDNLSRLVGYGLCHQLPQRSFFAGGHQLPVCARDTGIYLGFMASLMLMAAIDRGRRRAGFPRAWVVAVGVLLLGAMVYDGLTSYAGLRATTNALRLATGLGTGWALPLMVVPMLNSSLWTDPSAERVLGGRGETAMWLAGLPATYLIVYYVLPRIGTAYLVVVIVAILVTFIAVNLIVISLFPKFERRFSRLLDARGALVISLALGVLEMAGASGLRVVAQTLFGAPGR